MLYDVIIISTVGIKFEWVLDIDPAQWNSRAYQKQCCGKNGDGILIPEWLLRHSVEIKI